MVLAEINLTIQPGLSFLIYKATSIIQIGKKKKKKVSQKLDWQMILSGYSKLLAAC